MTKYTILAGSLLLASASTLFGAALAADVTETGAAGDVYDNGWQTGDNGGTGFGAWNLVASTTNTNNAGFFVASSTGNGGSGGSVPSDIDTANEAWGMYANSGATVRATRPFSSQLFRGETVSINFDNGFIINGSSVGVRFETASGTSLLDFQFVGGTSNYTLNGGSTGLGFTGEGLTLSLFRGASNSYTFTATRLAGGTFSSTLTLSQPVSRVSVYNNNAGGGGDFNVYANGLRVVPEPATLGLLAGAGVLALRRRK